MPGLQSFWSPIWGTRPLFSQERKERKERKPFGPSVWFSLSGGREAGAAPRKVLPMLCKAVNWGSAKDVQEAYRLLNDWDAIDAAVALQLLDKTFPDPKARTMKLRSDRSDRVDQIGGS